MVSIEFRTIADFGNQGGGQEPLVSGIHSGNAGDIIYSLPTVRALGIRHLYLNVFQSASDPFRKLTEETALALCPLLLAQPYLDRVSVVEAGVPLEHVRRDCLNVDYILDRFRLQRSSEMHLTVSHARAQHAKVRSDQPFLVVPSAPTTTDPYVVVSLTDRYRTLSEEFVRDLLLYFKGLVLVGIPEELRAVSGMAGEVFTAQDFLQLAQKIQNAALFIGNPNLPYAIAEGLKCLRIVDLPSDSRNAFPVGPRGYVLPDSRAGFVDLLTMICSEHEELRRCCRLSRRYSEMAAAINALGKSSEAIRPEIPLFAEAGAGRCEVRVAVPEFFRVNDCGILIHPGPPGLPRSELAFRNLVLTGPYRFSADISVDHESAEPVLMSVEFHEEKEGRVLAGCSWEVEAGRSITADLEVPRTDAPVRCTLSTEMVARAQNSNYAWAWFKFPRLVAK